MRLDAVLAFFVAMAVATLLTPLAARFARRVGRSRCRASGAWPRASTPLLGGLAILVAVLVAALIWMPATIKLPGPSAARQSGGTVDTWGLLAGAVLIAVVGAIDDVCDLPPLAKLIGQIAAAVIAVEAGRWSPT